MEDQQNNDNREHNYDWIPGMAVTLAAYYLWRYWDEGTRVRVHWIEEGLATILFAMIGGVIFHFLATQKKIFGKHTEAIIWFIVVGIMVLLSIVA